jgi:hypothetical protein
MIKKVLSGCCQGVVHMLAKGVVQLQKNGQHPPQGVGLGQQVANALPTPWANTLKLHKYLYYNTLYILFYIFYSIYQGVVRFLTSLKLKNQNRDVSADFLIFSVVFFMKGWPKRPTPCFLGYFLKEEI